MGNPEIYYLGLAISVNHYVARLNVPVDYTFAVKIFDDGAYLTKKLYSLSDRKVVFVAVVVYAPPCNIVHDEVR
jgi:hypothetical protein